MGDGLVGFIRENLKSIIIAVTLLFVFGFVTWSVLGVMAETNGTVENVNINENTIYISRETVDDIVISFSQWKPENLPDVGDEVFRHESGWGWEPLRVANVSFLKKFK